jgi:VWFA-related protein
MTKRHVVATAASLIALLVATTVFVRAQAIQRSIYATVVDGSGKVVTDLGPSDFIVREDGVSREVLKVGPATAPLQIALLLDDSEAASAFLTDYREALKTFIAAIAAESGGERNHSISIVTLAARPTIKVNYTSDENQLQQIAGRLFIQSDSGTTLLDGIYEVSQGILKRESSRPVIVAITSEGPETSHRSYLHVLDMLEDSGATLYVISIGARMNVAIERGRVIDEGTRDSGGNLDTVLTSRALAGRLKDLAFELTHQYLVTYAHPDSLIPPEEVTVSTRRPELKARGRIVKDAIEERR